MAIDTRHRGGGRTEAAAMPLIGEAPAPQLQYDVLQSVIRTQTERIGKPVVIQEVALGMIDLMPYIPPIEWDLNVGTIVPLFDERVIVTSMPVELMSQAIPDSKFSPAPASIFGSGTAVGTIMVYVGKRLVAEIAAEIGWEGLRRIGQRVVAGARITGKTPGDRENAGRHVQVIAENQRSGFLPNRKHYDQPCKFWEFWCWIA